MKTTHTPPSTRLYKSSSSEHWTVRLILLRALGCTRLLPKPPRARVQRLLSESQRSSADPAGPAAELGGQPRGQRDGSCLQPAAHPEVGRQGVIHPYGDQTGAFSQKSDSVLSSARRHECMSSVPHPCQSRLHLSPACCEQMLAWHWFDGAGAGTTLSGHYSCPTKNLNL